MKYESYQYQRLIINDTCRYQTNERKEGLTLCKSLKSGVISSSLKLQVFVFVINTAAVCRFSHVT